MALEKATVQICNKQPLTEGDIQEIKETLGITAGLQGTQYVYVAADGTNVENAAELQAAYTTAQSMNPTGTNRITVIAAPGNYNFLSNFVMSTQFIDLVSLDGNRSIIFNGTGTISITANDVFVKGVNVTTKKFTIARNLNLLKVENCQGGNNSFGVSGIISGTFTNCQSGNNSFGAFGTASGTFKDCLGGSSSFGSNGTASGTFTNCQGSSSSFGTTASGTFTNCVGGGSSFGAGGNGITSGTFTNCQGGNFSFGGFGGTLNGKLFYCRTAGIFQTVSGAGVTRLCIDGNNVENNQG